VTVIYNGLDFRRIASNASRSEALATLGLRPEPNSRFISIVANMRHEVKDYPMFLRAARQVKEAVPEAAFLLAGEGELQDSLEQMANDLGIQNSTYFLGRCENIGALLGVSEVCVLSSKAEGFSNSILEYMAAARPVVATNVGGAAELITEGETGHLVTAGDDEMMAARLVSLLQDPQTARAMGQAGKRLVEKKFSCDAQRASTEELYNRLLQRS
jgi:glycosyltransferase involved in cell wall biosynthesis